MTEMSNCCVHVFINIINGINYFNQE